jgi:hypothetical protein
MSPPTFSDAAISRARRLVADARCQRPIVFVTWQPEARDLHRGTDGEAIWTHVADAGLEVTVLDWDLSVWPDKTDAPLETTRIGDLDVHFTRTPSRHLLEGRTIDFDGHEFIVR